MIAPHPDDEIIGCAGLIQRVKSLGGKIYILFLTVGDTVEFSKNGNSTKKQRLQEITEVANLLGYDDYHIAFPGNGHHLQLDTIGQKKIMNTIERLSPISIEQSKPDIISFPSINSYNQDHRIAARAAHACVRPASATDKFLVPIVLSYEELADQWALQNNLHSNTFIKLTEQEIVKKQKAMKLYKSQVRNGASPRSIRALKTLAHMRGFLAGARAAETFYCHRFIQY